MHKPVLLQESMDALDLKEGETFLDGTVGSGGHSAEAAQRLGGKLTIVGLDQDPEAIERSRKRLEGAGAQLYLKCESFRNLDKALDELGIGEVDAILLDIGISSDQIDESGRGFSFLRNEPLDMRMSGMGITAADILNSFSESALETIIRGFGEERYSKMIARGIAERREASPFETTRDLVEAVESSVPGSYQRGRIHPATRAFQALRIAVNEELSALEEGLDKAFGRLKPGGRLAVITFHSLEDRIVKNFFRDLAASEGARIITKKPITPSEAEIKVNPRSRSAKLRAIIK